MQINRCVSCMEETAGYPCPHCGFDAGAQSQPGYALPWNTILCGKYLVGKVLGQGGFGITYVGWDLALEVKVAIKEYYPSGQVVRQSSMSTSLQWSDAARSETARRAGMESFLKEARKMARVDRIRQVVRVRDMFYENDTAYIIMDFVKGETLKVRLEREGPLPFAQAMDIFRPALAALGEVHGAGLVHRDLSPDNIMLEPGGGVRILDLGAAKDLTANRGASSMLVTKGGFSPLEQYGQRGGSGPWTDVYAMAATIYYTLTGILPPNAVDRLDGDELRWDVPGLRELPAPACEALQKALAVRAKDRTQSMGEFLAGLEQTNPEPEPEPGPQQEPELQTEPVPEPEPVLVPEPESIPEPEPEQGAQAAPDVQEGVQPASGEGSNGAARRQLPDIVAAFIAATGAVLASAAWAAFYGSATYRTVLVLRPFGMLPPLAGGVLVAVGFWFVLRSSPQLSARVRALLSLLAGSVPAIGMCAMRSYRGVGLSRLLTLPVFCVGSLLGAICTWIILKKISNLSTRAIAVASIIAGIVLLISVKIQVDLNLYWWWSL